MRRIGTRLLAALLSALLCALCGCGFFPEGGTKDVSAHERTLFAMDTEMDLRLYGDEDEACLAELAELLTRLDRQLSVTDPDSALSALNGAGASEDETLCALVSRSLELGARTGGALDISLYPVSLAWGFTTGTYQVPAEEELEALRGITGIDRLKLSAGRVELAEGMKLDLGAVAKGYAADLCRALAEERGLSGVLALGGNIQTVGRKPDGSPWIIGIQDPDNPGKFILTLSLTGSRAVVTSGDYQRYFERDGVRYCHILDPETLRPAQSGLRSVTVVAGEGFLADGLATALFVLGPEKGLELWRASSDFEAVFVAADGTVTVTPGLKELVSGGTFEVAGE